MNVTLEIPADIARGWQNSSVVLLPTVFEYRPRRSPFGRKSSLRHESSMMCCVRFARANELRSRSPFQFWRTCAGWRRRRTQIAIDNGLRPSRDCLPEIR